MAELPPVIGKSKEKGTKNLCCHMEISPSYFCWKVVPSAKLMYNIQDDCIQQHDFFGASGQGYTNCL